MVAHECQTFLSFFKIFFNVLFLFIYLFIYFIPFYVLLIISVLFIRISLSQFLHKETIMKIKYFLLDKAP